MNISKFKHQHEDILAAVAEMRRLVRDGIPQNADLIARLVIGISATIKLHLLREDAHLYPALAAANHHLADMGRRYQTEMGQIADAYRRFAGKWNTAKQVNQQPEQFREEANAVFKVLYQRIQRENVELYPAVEAHL